MPEKQTAIVTGAARGIGRAIAVDLAKIGYDIAAIDLTFDTADDNFWQLQGDISDLDSHQGLVGRVMDKYGRIDLLVNNAGVAPKVRLDILETTPESFDHVLATNLRGTFFLAQTVANTMIKLQGSINDYHPKIVFISSISAEISSPSRAEYCISKAGVSMASKIFAHRLAEFSILVFDIRPGIIETDMTAPAKDKYDELIADGLIPQNRWGQPKDVAKAVTAIAQGYFDYSTGMTFDISGGMDIQRL